MNRPRGNQPSPTGALSEIEDSNEKIKGLSISDASKKDDEDWYEFFERASIDCIRANRPYLKKISWYEVPSEAHQSGLLGVLHLEFLRFRLFCAMSRSENYAGSLDSWLRDAREDRLLTIEGSDLFQAVSENRNGTKTRVTSEILRREIRECLGAALTEIEEKLKLQRPKYSELVPVYREEVSPLERDVFFYLLSKTGIFSPWGRERSYGGLGEDLRYLMDVFAYGQLSEVLGPKGRLLLESWIDLDPDHLSEGWQEVRLHISPKVMEPILRAVGETSTFRETSLLTRFQSNHEVMESQASLDEVILDEERKAEIRALCAAYRRQVNLGLSPRLTLLFRGAPGTGKTMLSHVIARELGMRVMRVHLSSVSANVFPLLMALLAERSKIQKCVLLMDECEDFISANPHTNTSDAWGKLLFDAFTGVAVFTTNYDVPEGMDRRMTYVLDMKAPSFVLREKLLIQEVEKVQKELQLKDVPGAAELRVLARSTHLAGGYLRLVLELAAAFSPEGTLRIEAIRQALKQREKTIRNHNNKDATLKPRISWSEVQLGERQREPIERFMAYARDHFVQLSEDLHRNPLLPKGVTALFYGPSGTGKTIAAEAIAHTLGKEFRRVSPSHFLSRFVGDSEKRIKEAFQRAEENGEVLFLDEAEGLLMDRQGAVRSWEKTQVEEFLVQLENFKGIFIAATNHLEMLDSAMGRRFLFSVKFEMPEGRERLALWCQFLQVDPEQEFIQKIAHRYELSGGEIRNVAVQALAHRLDWLMPDDISSLERFCREALRSRTGRTTARIGIGH